MSLTLSHLFRIPKHKKIKFNQKKSLNKDDSKIIV